MIEVSIWFGDPEGSGCDSFLVDTEEPSESFFNTAAYVGAITKALAEFKADHSKPTRPTSISRVDVRRVPTRILKI